MAKINQIITANNFESIRDRIAQILVLELANQKALTTNVLFDATVWTERFIPFDKTDLPAINVYFVNAPYDNQTPITRRGTNTYHIDIHVSNKHTTGIDGDKNSLLKVQKLLGVISEILSNPIYNTLDFGPGQIRNTTVNEIQVAQPRNDSDANQVATGRVVFQVVANETSSEIQPITASEYQTTVTLGETDKGYFYKIINT